jgi:O-antigen ligase
MRHRTGGWHGGTAMRSLVLALLFAAPLALGAVQEIVFVPLLVGCALAGSWAWWRARRHERHGHAQPEVPAGGVLLALHGLVLLQLVPLPPLLLRLLSPGSYAFYDRLVLTPPLNAWRSISVSPPDTLRGLAFLAGFSLLFLAVFRELASPPWRRRVLWTIVGAGLAITVEAFVQSASSDPLRIWGIWHPRWDWGVFGPYVNRNNFAGYLVMSAAVALGLALEALSRLRGAWGRRRRGILALGDAEGNAALRAAVVVMVLVAGLVASTSRGGISAFAAAALLMPLAARHKGRTAAAVLALASLGVAWIGLGRFFSAFGRGVRGSRVDLWLDMLKMFPRFPLLGDGLNAFSTAYPWYQTVGRTEWIGEAHNEYLQALLDTGLVGFVLFGFLLVTVFRRALGRAAQGPLELGILTALLGLALHNLVEFNWQIPANAATWVALAALACREPEPAAASHEPEPGGPPSKVLEAVAGRT